MTLKKQGWVPYGRRAKFVEINVKDNENQTIDFFKIYNKKADLEKNEVNYDLKRVIKILKEKHKFGIQEEREEEKDWLKKDMEW